MSSKEQKNVEVLDSENEEVSNTENCDEDCTVEEDNEEEEEDDDERVPVDLSENEYYRGICTLLEDEDGNNILEYISLLHTELIGINKSLENLRNIRKDIGRLADCAELFMKSKKLEIGDIRKEKEKEKRR